MNDLINLPLNSIPMEKYVPKITFQMKQKLILALLVLVHFNSYAQDDLPHPDLVAAKLRTVDSLNSLPPKPMGHNPLTSPDSDCSTAISVCQQTYTQTNSYPNYGFVQDLPNPSGCGGGNGLCLLAREQKTVWYTFTVQNSGTFGFTINTTYDYDFALYNVTGLPNIGCSQIQSGSIQPVRCNFSATYGTTGLTLPPSGTIPLCVTASGSPLMPGLNVTAGQTYVLVVDNYTMDATGYTITFNGTAQIYDTSPPSISGAPLNCTNPTTHTITLNFDEPIRCSSINPANFTLTSNPGGWSIASIVGSGCGSSSYTNTITVTLNVGAGSGTVTLQATGIQDKCNNTMAPYSTSFTAIAPFSISPSSITICQGTNVTLNGPTMPAGYTYSWSNGATTQNITVSPTTTTTYTLTVTSPSGCSRSANVTVNVVPPPVATASPNAISLCPSTTGTSTVTATIGGSPCTNCTYAWSGGLGTDVSVPSSTRTGLTAGTYTVTVSAPGCATTSSVTITVTQVAVSGSTTCDVLYVTPTGTGSGLTPSDPTNITAAIASVNCQSTVIKMAIGTYNISAPIVMKSFITLEGGYNTSFTQKVSASGGQTIINRTATNIEGTANVDPRIVAISCIGISNFRLQDLTIQTANAPAPGTLVGNLRGISTYAVYLSGCSNYNIVRCRLLAGQGGQGTNGTPGVGFRPDGSPGTGGVGSGQSWTACGGSSAAGSPGSSSSTGAPGGGGGGGVGGGGCNIFGCNANNANGNNGGTGGFGGNGANGSTLPTPGLSSPYYQPAGQSPSGSPGGHGGGGGGGSGGDIGTCCTCSCGSGNAYGGNGGNGGRGGNPGTGGYGGGGSFALYVVANGTGGNLRDLDFSSSSGIGGAGGIGASGQPGFAGSSGGYHSRCGGFWGGTGGTGGAGGNGGNGGSGANGLAANIALHSGSTITLNQNGSVFTLGSGSHNPASFGLITQPTLTVSNLSCTQTPITHSTTASSPTFTSFGSGVASPALPAAGSPQNVSYNLSAFGRKNVTFNSATTYPSQTFSNNTPVNIPDNNCTGATSSINVTGYLAPINTANITVTINITHTFDGDLEILLIAPNGQVLGLVNRRGGGGDNFINTSFNDAYPTSISAGAAPFTGNFRQETATFGTCLGSTITSFGAINGGSYNPNGLWQLRVYDRAGVDVGTINSWSITFPSYSVTNTHNYADFNNIIINPPSAGTITPSNPQICSGTVQNFISSLNGLLGYTFVWSTTNLSGTGSASISSPTAGATNITFTNSSTSTDYVVRVNLQVNSQCCGAIATLQTDVTVKPNPALPIVSGATICPGSSFTITPTPVSGINFKYYDNAMSTLLGTGPSFTTPTLTSTTTYRVVAENAFGCESGNVPVTITVSPTPPPTAISAARCDNGQLILSVNPVPGAEYYEWYDNSETTLLQQSTSISYTTPFLTSTTTYKVRVKMPGCLPSAFVPVTATIGGIPSGLRTWNGSVSSDWFNSLNWTPSCVPSCSDDVLIPVVVTNYPTINFNPSNAHCQNFTIQSGAVLNFGLNGRLNVCGNFTVQNAASFIMPVQSEIHFIGTNPQTITLNENFDFYTVVINNTSTTYPQVVLSSGGSQNMNIRASDGKLIFVNGVLRTQGTREVNIKNDDPASLLGYGVDAYIHGNLRRAINGNLQYDFPVGDAHESNGGKGYQLASVNFTNNTNVSELYAFFTPTPATAPLAVTDCGTSTPYSQFLDNGFWTLNATGSTAVYDITLYNRNYTNYPGSGAVTNQKRDNGMSPWGLSGSCWTPSTPAMSRRLGVSGFSDHATAFSTTPFPVELLSLRATPKYETKSILVDWVTASEFNNAGFYLQRSDDGLHFTNIAWIEGNGTTQNQIQYAYDDKNVEFNQKYYYRLDQRDLNGTSTISNVVEAILFSGESFNVVVYPNPAQNFVRMEIQSLEDREFEWILYNAIGQEVIKSNRKVNKGTQIIEIPLTSLSNGTYQLQMKSEDFVKGVKLIKVQ